MNATAPALADLQRDFGAVLRGEERPALNAWVRDAGIGPATRLRIYRHAVQSTQVEALATGFPALRRWVGEACFDALAARHAARRGSRSGNLQDYGSGFAEFIAEQAELEDFPWLADLARLEWLRQEVMLAGAAPVPTQATLMDALASIDGAPRVCLQPHVRAAVAAVPVLDLWSYAMQPGGRAVDPAAGGQGVLLWREDGQVAMSALSPEQALAVNALRAGASLSRALGQARLVGDPGAALKPLLAYALVTDIVPSDGEEVIP